jgi:periodic tryptophan protein 2
VDEDGHCLLVNVKRRIVLHRFHFKDKVRAIEFSPDDKYVAVSHGNHVHCWLTPGLRREFAPFVLHRKYTGHHDDVITIDWSEDSKFLMTGSKDMTARIYSLNTLKDFVPVTLAGHHERVVSAFFAHGMKQAYTVAHDGACFVWDWSDPSLDEDEALPDSIPGAAQWSLVKKHYFNEAKVTCAALHKKNELLVVGFSSGVFGLYEMPGCANIHKLSMSQQQINTVSINSTGDWLAFGSAKLGQLLVWEWQSETYVFKQQGHFAETTSLEYSPDGQIIATGGQDAKVKLWNVSSGFCFVTFPEHTATVTAVAFIGRGRGAANAVVSASLDGTVRAWDLTRYRNFRTLTTPTPCQFLSLAVDSSGEVVCAGAMDPFCIYVWSMQTGRLLDVLSSHQAPVSSLAFSPTAPILCSGSWDTVVYLWDVYKSSTPLEPFAHKSDVLAVAYRPDGQQVSERGKERAGKAAYRTAEGRTETNDFAQTG